MAFFWLATGLLVQLYWDDLQRRVPIDRTMAGVIFFVFFSYNFIRWRLERMRRQAIEDAKPQPPPPRPRVEREPDPTFDFSEQKPTDGDSKKLSG